MKAMLSTFTPSLMPAETLEAILVQRHDLADHLVGLIRDSASSGSKSQMLLIGPRGIGKTHMVSLVYHRVQAMEDLRDRLLIAWLREEEWGVTTFRDLLIRILRTLAQERNDAELGRRIDALYQHEPQGVEHLAGKLLIEHVAGRTLLLIVENLDAIFEALGEEGQQRLRAFIQENPFFTILATSQSLFAGVQLRTSPFYGFFSIHHLEALTFDQATELLAKIAELDGDKELADCIRTPTGRARIRAVHHLGGGNHRVYVIFSQFLTTRTLDELVDAVMQMIEKLTPYYQARMASLSPQQRQIVEFLCDRRGAAPVKDIARHCFATSQSISSALGALGELGYVRYDRLGRESYYELREPLMRICIEVKKQRGQPVRLLVDFLRVWYSCEELQQQLGTLARSTCLDRSYVQAALRVSAELDEDLRVAACRADYDSLMEVHDLPAALAAAEDLLAVAPSADAWSRHGLVLGGLGRHGEALASFDKALEIDPKDAWAWCGHGVALTNLGRHAEAILAFGRAVELKPSPGPLVILVATNALLRGGAAGAQVATAWVQKWKARAGDREEFRVPLRLAEVAARYAVERDQRILLELPVEERSIVRQMLDLDGSGDEAGSREGDAGAIPAVIEGRG